MKFLKSYFDKNFQNFYHHRQKLGHNSKQLHETSKLLISRFIFFYFYDTILLIEINLIIKNEVELAFLRPLSWCLKQGLSNVELQHPLDIIALDLLIQYSYCPEMLTKDVINCFRKQKYMKYNAIVSNKSEK